MAAKPLLRDDWRLDLQRSRGCASSGSEHDGSSDFSLSPHLCGFFFFHTDEDDADSNGPDRPDPSQRQHEKMVPSAETMVRDLISVDGGDRFGKALVGVVRGAVGRFADLRGSPSAFRTVVMAYLRDSGYNAGLCKARWANGDGVTAGNHEYIDVVRSQSGRRYIVDVDFAGEFEIARRTEEYERVLGELPTVYVGKPDELRKAVRVIAAAAKLSLRAREMHVPPWRKARYMHNKWLGPYKRTTNAAPGGSTTPSTGTVFGVGREVPCRAVGFTTPRVAPPAAAT